MDMGYTLTGKDIAIHVDGEGNSKAVYTGGMTPAYYQKKRGGNVTKSLPQYKKKKPNRRKIERQNKRKGRK